MRFRAWLVIGGMLFSSVAGCSSQNGTGIPGDPGATSVDGKADSTLPEVVLTADNDGNTITVTEGQPVIVRLASNPSTGYGWDVVRTDRSFGHPEESYENNPSGALGAPGTAIFRWETKGALPLVGTHSVDMEYKRSFGSMEVADTFSFTVNIEAASTDGEVTIDGDDNGATITVTEGQDVVLRLPSNPSTGYGWEITSTDRTFGYPEESYENNPSGALGAPGTAIFRWQTSGFLSMVGSHTVQMEYKRSFGSMEVADYFTFTVDVQPAGAAADVVITEDDDGATIPVTEGQDVVLRLSSNPSTGYGWDVVRTDRTFGYPEESFENNPSGALGAPGTAVLRWSTTGGLSMIGRHTVQLEYKRPFGSMDVADTFSFTVDVRAAEAADDAVIATGADLGGEIDVPFGKKLQVKLQESAFHGISWQLIGTDRTFGYPEISTEEPPPGLLDGPTTVVFTWETSGSLVRPGGSHTVTFEQTTREGTETFQLTINIVE